MIRLETDMSENFFNSSTSAPKDSSYQLNSKSSGRWTKEEHQKFVESLRKFGKNWKQVEEYVGTRNGAQIRSHAQKFFNRLEREYDVKITDNKTQNSNKKSKDSVRKISQDSFPTYDSSHGIFEK